MLENNINGIQHLGIPVTNLERSKAFYAAFGFTVVMEKEFLSEGETVRAAMVKKDDLTIELYQLPEAECREITRRGDGHIDHIALNVLDIEQAYADIQKSGFEILETNAPVFLPFWANGVKFFTVRGPDGEKVEFNQIL